MPPLAVNNELVLQAGQVGGERGRAVVVGHMLLLVAAAAAAAAQAALDSSTRAWQASHNPRQPNQHNSRCSRGATRTWYTPGGKSLTSVKSLPDRCIVKRWVQLSNDPSSSTWLPPWPHTITVGTSLGWAPHLQAGRPAGGGGRVRGCA